MSKAKPDSGGGGVIIIHGNNTPAVEVDGDKTTMASLMGYCILPASAAPGVRSLYDSINTMLSEVS